MRKIMLLGVLMALVLSAMPVSAAGPMAGMKTYGNVTLTGGYQAGHFSDAWDLTKGDIEISFTYDATGMAYNSVQGVSSRAELGVRSPKSGDFSPTDRWVLAQPLTVKLIAGQHTVVGDITVSSDGNHLYVKYTITKPGCVLKESHVAVAGSLDGIPQTKKGNPIPGQFPYKAVHNPPVTDYTYVIDVSAWMPRVALKCGETKTLYIAVHGVVACGDGEETAWAAGPGFPGKNWATYFTYDLWTSVEGSGVWLATKYVGTPETAGQAAWDKDDRLILQKANGGGEEAYDQPISPSSPYTSYGIWFDRDGVAGEEAAWWGMGDGTTYNTKGEYKVVIQLHATGPESGEAYMTINGVQQGFSWSYRGQPPLIYPAGMTFKGDMTRLILFYGLNGYGASHTAVFKGITVKQ
jgi:hypothetical protein